MTYEKQREISDTGERILPTAEGELSFVFSRHKFAYEYVQKLLENKTVIDVGCGTGYGCRILAEKAKLVYGIDYSAEAIAYCKVHYIAPNIKYFQMDATSMEFDRQFDVAVAFQVVEHLADVESFVDQLKRIVKQKGTIFITTPNVRTPKKENHSNPFHCREMNYSQFSQLLISKFSSLEILGVAYASRNRLRSFVATTPIYKLGKILKRKSRIKKIANRAFGLTSFKLTNTNVEEEAADFFAVCHNN